MSDKKQISNYASIKNSKGNVVIQNCKIINPTFIASSETVADIESRFESINIDEHLLGWNMPENSEARFFVESFLLGEDGGIGQTLSAVFNANAAGSAWAAKNNNLLPLVEFARDQEFFCNTVITGQEPELHHCIAQIKQVALRLKQLMDEAEGLSSKNYYKKEMQFANHIIQELTNEPHFCRLSNIYQLLLGNWQSLMGLSITYRLLSDLAQLEKGWKNDPEVKLALCAILKSVSEDWM